LSAVFVEGRGGRIAPPSGGRARREGVFSLAVFTREDRGSLVNSFYRPA